MTFQQGTFLRFGLAFLLGGGAGALLMGDKWAQLGLHLVASGLLLALMAKAQVTSHPKAPPRGRTLKEERLAEDQE
jgi:membrane protein implicated in regulation of membrane protease activity